MTQDEVLQKVVLITGASAGIGAAVAIEAASKGYTLALNARRGDRLECLASELNVPTLVIPASLDDPATPERLVSETIARFGRLDVLINNAGIGLPHLFADCEPELLRRQLEVNLVAPLLLTRQALPSLIENRGVVINIGSSITSIPNPSLGAYGTTKAALAWWSHALRRELGHAGLSVCLVEPGPIKTEFFNALTGLSETWHALLDAPPAWMSGDVDELARRIVRLIERPRRRISYLKRVVWPYRVLGGLLQLIPSLGDLAVSSVVRHYDGIDPRTHKTRSGRPEHAAPTE